MSVELEDQILERKEFMERDKSGYILKEQQLKSIKDNFIKKKGNNKIDLYELISALKKFGINYNEDDPLGEELENAKINRNSKIDFDQFIDLITTKLSEMDSEKDLANFFSLFLGKDNTDKIEYDHLRRADSNLKDNQIEEMIEKADKDKDGKINFEEFYDIITKKI